MVIKASDNRYLEKWSSISVNAFWNLASYHAMPIFDVDGWTKLSSTSQPLIKRNAFQILFANCFPCWHKSSSNIKSFPAAELSSKPTLTPSAPYVSISFKASGEFPNDFDILRLCLSRTKPVK